MKDSIRTQLADDAQYPIVLPKADVTHVTYRWANTVDDALGAQVIELMRRTSEGAPIIGFAETITDAEAIRYLDELRSNLAAEKVRLLTIFASTAQLIGLCTLRRNLNPNNRHITDLAKGMIHDAYRGGGVLPAAFVEIALQCDLDNVELVTLDVRDGTPAHRVWEHYGFQTWGTLPDYARANGKVHAGHFMMQRVGDLKERALGMLLGREADRTVAAKASV
ncbi:GNAT family N-acetyltransferase [Burkholderia pyrrocinia]|uniref:GNAT family N-acetyltransferase n=1 Tax=Burkholderia pyrrocinia TaxID=60550 RepID=UPI0015761D98|nr:GNAT family N-acetyltransferase [Burkholderia pyrrocinia]NTX28902.1 GNAT family N-acetyltransferase [Burkholderia pyrrocinia]